MQAICFLDKRCLYVTFVHHYFIHSDTNNVKKPKVWLKIYLNYITSGQIDVSKHTMKYIIWGTMERLPKL